jgi:hypothetical protein
VSGRNRITQDRRSLARVSSFLDCEFAFAGDTRKAVILDLSLNGALLASRVPPPKDATVTLYVTSKLLKRNLALNGTVLRSCEFMAEAGGRNAFAIRFNGRLLELAPLVTALHANARYTSEEKTARRWR